MPSGPNAENAKNMYDKAMTQASMRAHFTQKGVEAMRQAVRDDMATPRPRTAKEALKIVGEGDMGANVPSTPRGRRGMPAKMRKGRSK